MKPWERGDVLRTAHAALFALAIVGTLNVVLGVGLTPDMYHQASEVRARECGPDLRPASMCVGSLGGTFITIQVAAVLFGALVMDLSVRAGVALADRQRIRSLRRSWP